MLNPADRADTLSEADNVAETSDGNVSDASDADVNLEAEEEPEDQPT